MCDQIKDYYLENWYKRETLSRKTEYPFNILAMIKVDEQIFWLCNDNYNHEAALTKALKRCSNKSSSSKHCQLCKNKSLPTTNTYSSTFYTRS